MNKAKKAWAMKLENVISCILICEQKSHYQVQELGFNLNIFYQGANQIYNSDVLTRGHW